MDAEYSIISNKDVLSKDYTPEKLLYREGERKQLSINVHNKVHTIVTGPYGCGKTTLAKSVIRDFNTSKEGHAAYADCSLYPTTYSILKEILPRSELVFYRSNYELTRELKKYVKDKEFVVVLDNFGHLKEADLIAKFMTLGIGVVLISDDKEHIHELDLRIRSNIPSIMRLENYTVEQSFEIIKARAEKALTRYSYTDEILREIAEKVKGNITLGLNALKAIIMKAESEGKRKIEDFDIEIVVDNPHPRLKLDEKVLLKIIEEEKTLPPNRLYDAYTDEVNHPKGKRAFRNYMQNLCSKGFVEAIGEKKGRVYKFAGGESVQGHSNM